jgi:hypothetical protein
VPPVPPCLAYSPPSAPSSSLPCLRPTAIKKKNPNWLIEEDKQLCVVWLNTSHDSVIGVGQEGLTFWERIYHFYTNLVAKLNKEKKNNKKLKPLHICLQKQSNVVGAIS